MYAYIDIPAILESSEAIRKAHMQKVSQLSFFEGLILFVNDLEQLKTLKKIGFKVGYIDVMVEEDLVFKLFLKRFNLKVYTTWERLSYWGDYGSLLSTVISPNKSRRIFRKI